MAFNINAHVILSGPKNIKAVTASIQKQLGSIKARVDIQIPKDIKNIAGFNKSVGTLTKNLNTLRGSTSSLNTQLSTLSTHFQTLGQSSASISKAQSDIQKNLSKTGKEVNRVGNEIEAFGKDAALAIRRFSAFTVATGIVFGFVRAVTTATKAAINYEREITKVIQVTGAGATKIDELNKSITQLSVSLGVDANELAELSRIFAQTGQSIEQVRSSIRAVARSTLAPTFGSMKNTAEGLIAAMAQFNIVASRQEEVLAGLNAVSKKFAVEAEDLVSVIRRAGGVFSQSAGQFRDPVDALNELIGIFTAVRSTTRESADTIAVGLRTIFTRIQRRGTIEFLKQFNIELVNAKGQFIGMMPAFNELAKGLDSIIKKGDALTLSAITEELGGVRQVGKLIPAITQFNKALAATKIAGEAAAEGLGKDVALGLKPLGKQFEQLQQRFSALIREISQSQTFQGLAKVALSLGNAFLSVSETLKPLLPLLTTFAAIKLSKGLFDFGVGFVGGLRKGGGAGGAGGALGGAVTGGGGGGGGKPDAGTTAGLSAVTTALNKNAGLLGTNNIAIGNLDTKIGANTVELGSVIPPLTTALGQLPFRLDQLTTAINQIKFTGGFSPFGGGGPRKFAKGGPVRGPSHSRGGVPAVLEGGEYVIPKGYFAGGAIAAQQKILNQPKVGAAILESASQKKFQHKTDLITINEDQVRSLAVREGKNDQGIQAQIPKNYTLIRDRLNPENETSFRDHIYKGLRNSVDSAGAAIARDLGLVYKKIPETHIDEFVNSINKASLGNAFENILNAIATGSKFGGLGDSARSFDFTKGLQSALGGKLQEDFKNLTDVLYIDAKASMNAAGTGEMHKKTLNTIVEQLPTGSTSTNAQGLDAVKVSVIKDILTGKTKQGREKYKLAQTKYNALRDETGISADEWQRRKIEAGGFEQLAATFAAGGNVFKPRGTDTVPAMLTPGEFVINKKSAQSIGHSNLTQLNHYRTGGGVRAGAQITKPPPPPFKGGKRPAKRQKAFFQTGPREIFHGSNSGPSDEIEAAFLQQGARSDLASGLGQGGGFFGWSDFGSARSHSKFISKGLPTSEYSEVALGGKPMVVVVKTVLEPRDWDLDYELNHFKVNQWLYANWDKVKDDLTGLLDLSKSKQIKSAGRKGLFLKASSQAKKSGRVGSGTPFGSAPKLMTSPASAGERATITMGAQTGTIMNALSKGTNLKLMHAFEERFFANMPRGTAVKYVGARPLPVNRIEKFAAGGNVFAPRGTDTVPAMLTPGEFVINKSSAQKVGYGNLKKMNRYARGGAVGTQYLDDGGKVDSMGMMVGMQAATGAVAGFTVALSSFSTDAPVTSLMNLAFAVQQASMALNLLAPTLVQNIMKNKALSSITDKLGGRFKIVEKQFKAPVKAMKKASQVYSTAVKKGATSAEAFSKASNIAKRSLMHSFNANSLKGVLIKGFTGVPALIAALIAKPLIDGITKPFVEAIFGAVEKIEGTDIEGRKDGSRAGAGAAGGINALGGAAGKALGAAGTVGLATGNPLLAAGAAAFVGAVEVVKGVVVGMAKQAEFDAFIQLNKVLEDTTEILGSFNKLTIVNQESLEKLNNTLLEANEKFGNAFEASLKRGQTEQQWSIGGAAINLEDELGLPVFAASATVAGGAVLYATQQLAKIVPGKFKGLVYAVGALASVGTAAMTFGMRADQASKKFGVVNKAFQKATASFTPEAIKAVDEAFIKTTNSMLEQVSALDFSAIEDLSDIDVGDAFTGSAEGTRRLGEALVISEGAMDKVDTALTGASGSASRVVEEFNRLAKIKLLTNLTKNVKDEAATLSDKGSAELIQAFGKIRSAMNMDTGSFQDAFRGAIDEIDNMEGVTTATRASIRNYLIAEQERQQTILDVAATTLLAKEAAAAAQRGFDALAASLDNFSAQTKQIASQLSSFSDTMKTEFDNIFSTKVTIGKVSAVNPFDNIETATRSQISTGMDQVKSLAADPTDPAFAGIEGLVAASKEIPFAIKATLAAVAGKEDVTSKEVFTELIKQLKSSGVDTDALSPVALGALESAIQSGLSRQGQQDVSTATLLKDLLGEKGDVQKNLLALSDDARKAMSVAFEAATGYRNALLDIARLQEEMLRKERDFKISMLSKEASLQDRIAKATGGKTGTEAQARSRLGATMRVQTQMRTGRDAQGNFITSGVRSVADPFDVNALMDQRSKLKGKREEARERLGLAPGQAFDPKRVDVKDKAEANKLGLLNEQLNGNTAALQELSNNTSVLAAIEQEIATLQKKAIASQQAAMSFDEARLAVASGEMEQADFDKNFGNPLRAMLRATQGGTVTANEAVRIRKMQTDPAFKGFMDTAFEKETARRQASGETVFDKSLKGGLGGRRQIEERDVRREFNRNNQIGIASVAAASGVATDLNPAIREQHARSMRLEDEALDRGGDMAAFGATQGDAATQLFASQKEEFKKIFKTANEGLELAIQKFQDAVDDFRRLRSVGEDPDIARERHFQAALTLQGLEDKKAALPATATAEEKKKLDNQILDAEQKVIEARQDAGRSQQAQTDEAKRAAVDVKEADRMVIVADKKEKQLKADQIAQGKAATILAGLGTDDKFAGVPGGGRFGGMSFANKSTGFEQATDTLIKKIAEDTFGAGSTASDQTIEKLTNIRDQVAAEGGNQNDWAERSNKAVQKQLEAVEKQDAITPAQITAAGTAKAEADVDAVNATNRQTALIDAHHAEDARHNDIMDKFALAGISPGSIYVADDKQLKEVKKIAETGKATEEQSKSLKEMAKNMGVSTTKMRRGGVRTDKTDQELAASIMKAAEPSRLMIPGRRRGGKGPGITASPGEMMRNDPLAQGIKKGALRALAPVANALTTVTAGAGAGIGTVATGALKGTALVVPDAWGGEFIDAVGDNVWDSSKAAAQQMGGAARNTLTLSGDFQTDLLGQQLKQQQDAGNAGTASRWAGGIARVIGEGAVGIPGVGLAGKGAQATGRVAQTTGKVVGREIVETLQSTGGALRRGLTPAPKSKKILGFADHTGDISKADKLKRLDRLSFDEARIDPDYIPHSQRPVTTGKGKRPLSNKEIGEIKAKQNAAVKADEIANQKAAQQQRAELAHADDRLPRKGDRPPLKQQPSTMDELVKQQKSLDEAAGIKPLKPLKPVRPAPPKPTTLADITTPKPRVIGGKIWGKKPVKTTPSLPGTTPPLPQTLDDIINKFATTGGKAAGKIGTGVDDVIKNLPPAVQKKLAEAQKFIKNLGKGGKGAKGGAGKAAKEGAGGDGGLLKKMFDYDSKRTWKQYAKDRINPKKRYGIETGNWGGGIMQGGTDMLTIDWLLKMFKIDPLEKVGLTEDLDTFKPTDLNMGAYGGAPKIDDSVGVGGAGGMTGLGGLGDLGAEAPPPKLGRFAAERFKKEEVAPRPDESDTTRAVEEAKKLGRAKLRAKAELYKQDISTALRGRKTADWTMEDQMRPGGARTMKYDPQAAAIRAPWEYSGDIVSTAAQVQKQKQKEEQAKVDKAKADQTSQLGYESMLEQGQKEAEKTTKPYVHDPKSKKLSIDPANIGVKDMAERRRSDKLLEMREAATKSPDAPTRRFGESLLDTRGKGGARRRRAPRERQAPRAWIEKQQKQGLPTDYKSYLQDRRMKMKTGAEDPMGSAVGVAKQAAGVVGKGLGAIDPTKSGNLFSSAGKMLGGVLGRGKPPEPSAIDKILGPVESDMRKIAPDVDGFGTPISHGDIWGDTRMPELASDRAMDDLRRQEEILDPKKAFDFGFGGGGGATGGAVTGNVGEALATEQQQTQAATVSSGEEMGALIVVGMKSNIEGIGQTIAEEIKANLAGTDIKIQAQMGPIQVQITDGGNTLQRLGDGMIDTTKSIITSAFNAAFNSDGNPKDPDVNPSSATRVINNVPRQ